MHWVQMFVYFLAMTLRCETFYKSESCDKIRSLVRNISFIYSCSTIFSTKQKKTPKDCRVLAQSVVFQPLTPKTTSKCMYFFLIGRRWCHHMCKTVTNLKTTSFLPLASVSAENSTIAQSATKADSTRKRVVFLSTMIGLWMLGDRLRTCFIYTVSRRLRL